ncbi:DNA alkylation repair protein [Candidatus Shapirobacteria bacterium]|nr:DNA alkylation repair protein [Candidatus Shapirobacteria bacterium]
MSIHTELQKLNYSVDTKTRQWVQKYLGSDKPTRCIKSAVIQQIAKDKLKGVTSPNNLFGLIDDIYTHATTFEEMAIAANIFTKGRRNHDSSVIKYLDKWLNKTVGWAEVDSLCQSSISAIDMLKNWSKWRKQLNTFSLDKNVHKRRASMVLLCRSQRESDDSRLSDLAFELVNRLKGEKDILITKAISWILRCTVKHHPDELAVYLEDHVDTLPRVAYREASKKLATGKKN